MFVNQGKMGGAFWETFLKTVTSFFYGADIAQLKQRLQKRKENYMN